MSLCRQSVYESMHMNFRPCCQSSVEQRVMWLAGQHPRQVSEQLLHGGERGNTSHDHHSGGGSERLQGAGGDVSGHGRSRTGRGRQAGLLLSLCGYISRCSYELNKPGVRAVSICVSPVIQRGESIVSTVRYVYTVKPTAEGGIITQAHGLERQLFSPFNVRGGTFKMQAT